MGIGTPVTAYRYQAARADGRIITGRLEAPSASQAGTALAERGCLRSGSAKPPTPEARPSASRRDLALVFRSIAALAAAGVPLERALLASEPLAKGELRTAIAAARQELHEGRTLAQGLAASHGVVPAVVIGMIRAGERGGRLTRAIDESAMHLEQEAALVAQVRQALAYPLLLATAGLASVLVIGTVVVPKFATLLADLGEQLPTATRLLLDWVRFPECPWRRCWQRRLPRSPRPGWHSRASPPAGFASTMFSSACR